MSMTSRLPSGENAITKYFACIDRKGRIPPAATACTRIVSQKTPELCRAPLRCLQLWLDGRLDLDPAPLESPPW